MFSIPIWKSGVMYSGKVLDHRRSYILQAKGGAKVDGCKLGKCLQKGSLGKSSLTKSHIVAHAGICTLTS